MSLVGLFCLNLLMSLFVFCFLLYRRERERTRGKNENTGVRILTIQSPIYQDMVVVSGMRKAGSFFISQFLIFFTFFLIYHSPLPPRRRLVESDKINKECNSNLKEFGETYWYIQTYIILCREVITAARNIRGRLNWITQEIHIVKDKKKYK